jgi:hypothetical protein
MTPGKQLICRPRATHARVGQTIRLNRLGDADSFASFLITIDLGRCAARHPFIPATAATAATTTAIAAAATIAATTTIFITTTAIIRFVAVVIVHIIFLFAALAAAASIHLGTTCAACLNYTVFPQSKLKACI